MAIEGVKESREVRPLRVRERGELGGAEVAVDGREMDRFLGPFQSASNNYTAKVNQVQGRHKGGKLTEWSCDEMLCGRGEWRREKRTVSLPSIGKSNAPRPVYSLHLAFDNLHSFDSPVLYLQTIGALCRAEILLF